MCETCPPCSNPIKNCSCSSGCYQQPPRAVSFKPCVNYERPSAPMENNTIYRQSYIPNCSVAREPLILQPNTLKSSNAKMDTATIQKLSYQGHCGVKPPEPIRPPHHPLGGCGPMQTVTTQKHDFVPKPICVRRPIVNPSHYVRTDASLEHNTVNRLSYMPIDICQNPPPKPIVHLSSCERPQGPAEKLTVQKLSYMPICPLPKEIFPWSKQIHMTPPPYPCDQHTTYGLSYLPNCKTIRAKPITPVDGAQIFGCDIPKPVTVYNLSYMCGGNNQRPAPFLPRSTIHMPTGPSEKCTVYKLSYLQNYQKRAEPIRPNDNHVRPTAPMQRVTTQMHDFVPKPYSKPSAMIQTSSIQRDNAPIDAHTINRLSYMPVDICKFPPPKPYAPIENVQRPNGMVSDFTTYKLSYMPNCPPVKEPMPWATKVSYVKPTTPLETCTIQKLSYMPPGAILNQNCANCSCEKKMEMGDFPRAGICH